MKNKIAVVLLTSVLAMNSARADDDVWWAVGGFILGTVLADKDKERDPPPRQELPPPRRQPRMVPIYTKVCQVREQYDPWNRPLPPIRTCWQEITGYVEVYE